MHLGEHSCVTVDLVVCLLDDCDMYKLNERGVWIELCGGPDTQL